MDDKKQEMISEPDENGVRYYTIDGPGPSQESADGAGTASGGSGGPGKRKNSMVKPVLIFACILVGVIILSVACNRLGSDEDSQYADISKDHISVLYIEGTISGEDSDSAYNHEWVLNRLEDVQSNPNNKGLILFVNTPGGSVYETDEIYEKLLEYKQSGRPLYSAMGSMAASGGYYISAPADRIVANRNCWTGSIGVTIGTVFDISELLEKYGIKATTITAGKNKAMGGMTEPMTKEQKDILQSLVDEAYEQFVDLVAEGRNLPVAKVKKLADGRIYTAKQAMDRGLVDQIGTLEDAVSHMRQTYGLDSCIVSNMQYEDNSLFGSLFSAVAKAREGANKSDVQALLELMNEQGQMPISYMSEIQK